MNFWKWDLRGFSPKSENRRISIIVLQDKMSNSEIVDEQRELAGDHLSLESCVRVIWRCFPGAGALLLSLKVSAHPGSLFLASQSSFQLWEFLLSATVQQLLNCTFSALHAVSGILLFSSNRATQFGGEIILQTSPLAVLILESFFEESIWCRRCQAFWFFCAVWRVYPKQFTNPVTSKKTPLQIAVAEFDHWQPY